MRILGACFGAKIEHEVYEFNGEEYGHYIVTIMVEDDENWIEKTKFDSAWLPDIISVLTQCQKIMEDKNSFSVKNESHRE